MLNILNVMGSKDESFLNDGYTINKDWIPNLPEKDYITGEPEYIIVHETDNCGDSDESEMKYFKREWKNRSAFVQYFVDYDSITEGANPEFTAWGAGPKVNGRAIHIEMCHMTTQDKFNEVVKRTLWLINYLVKRFPTIKNDKIITHKIVSNTMGGTDHQDPDSYLEEFNYNWGYMKDDITYVINRTLPKYKVYQGNNFLQEFISIDDSVTYAKQFANANIRKENGDWIWSNIVEAIQEDLWGVKALKQLDSYLALSSLEEHIKTRDQYFTKEQEASILVRIIELLKK